MQRSDLLIDNGKIFVDQGKVIDKVAKKNVNVVVVGNPCNTNALLCMKAAPSIPKKNFTALTRLDQNRAVSQISSKLTSLGSKTSVGDVTKLCIWGNHSSTQFPDIFHA